MFLSLNVEFPDCLNYLSNLLEITDYLNNKFFMLELRPTSSTFHHPFGKLRF